MALESLEGEEAFPLSSREREIVASLANGATAKEIAKDLAISFHTVRSHIRNIYIKTGVCNRVELMRWLSYVPAEAGMLSVG
jgi:DNA-binding CsgD family transcriptional regulator